MAQSSRMHVVYSTSFVWRRWQYFCDWYVQKTHATRMKQAWCARGESNESIVKHVVTMKMVLA